MLSAQTTQRLTDKLAMASGIGNLAAQGAQGAMTVQGLVRLAPETLQALNTAQPMTSGGWGWGGSRLVFCLRPPRPEWQR